MTQVNKTIKFSSLTTQNSINSNDYLVGLRDDGSGNFIDFKYPASNVGSGGLKKFITSSVSSKTITDSFFDNEITEIVTNNQCYIKDVDFTQTGSDITFFYLDINIGQVLLAKV